MKKILSVLFIPIVLVLGFTFRPVQKSINPNQTKATQVEIIATPSSNIATSPRPTPISIPAHSGRSVRIPILTYHYIGNNPNPADKARDNLEVTPDKFEQQMDYLSKNGYQAISFDTLYAALAGKTTLPSKAVILTFDDGYIDFYFNAYPILKRFNMHAVSFIPTGLVGTSYYMNWGQIREIDVSGLVSFQAHSVNHPNMASLTNEQLKYQVSESKRILESQLGKPVNTFAYPYGISDARVWQAVRDGGFVGAVGTWYGNIVSEGTIYDMARIKVAGSVDIDSFAAKLN